MFPAMPTDVAVSDDGNLLVYSDTHIDVFDTATGDWVQTINIRKTRPLIKTGVLNLSMLQELPHITYLCSYQGMFFGNLYRVTSFYPHKSYQAQTLIAIMIILFQRIR